MKKKKRPFGKENKKEYALRIFLGGTEWQSKQLYPGWNAVFSLSLDLSVALTKGHTTKKLVSPSSQINVWLEGQPAHQGSWCLRDPSADLFGLRTEIKANSLKLEISSIFRMLIPQGCFNLLFPQNTNSEKAIMLFIHSENTLNSY